MRVKHDLRSDLGVVTTCAIDFFKAMRALPETEGAIVEDAKALSQQERQQVIDYLTQLCQTLYQIRERTLWVKRALEEKP